MAPTRAKSLVLSAVVFAIASSQFADGVRAQQRRASRDAKSGLALLYDQVALRQKAQDRSKGAGGISPNQIVVQLGAKANAVLKARRTPSEPSNPAQAKKIGDQFYDVLLTQVLAYQVSGKTEHLRKAEELMLGVSSWSRWNHTYKQPWKNSLDRDAILISVGLAYDVLRPHLREQTRQTIREAIVEKGLKPIRRSMPGGHPSAPHWPFLRIANTNHGAIGAAALGIGCLAVEREMDVKPYLDAAVENAAQYIEHSGGQDGGYPESTSYGCFALNRLQLFNDLMVMRHGIDLFERYDRKGWIPKFHEYILYAIYPDQSALVPFNDESGKLGLVTQRLAQASSYYRGKEIGGLCQSQLAKLRTKASAGSGDVFEFLYYDPNGKSLPLTKLPKFRFFRDIGHAFYRESWESQRSLYMAFKAERHNKEFFPVDPAHPQFDGGQVVMVKDGIRYLLDLGYQLAPSFVDVATVSNADLNKFSRSSLGHNNMLFNGEPQDKLESRISRAQMSEEGFIVEMDLARSYPESVQLERYRRLFIYQGGDLVIVDVFQGKAVREAAFRLLLTSIVARQGASLHDAEIQRNSYKIFPSLKGRRAEPIYGVMLADARDLHIEVVDRPLPQRPQKRGPSGYRYLEATLTPARSSKTVLINALSFDPAPNYAFSTQGGSVVIRNLRKPSAVPITISPDDKVLLR